MRKEHDKFLYAFMSIVFFKTSPTAKANEMKFTITLARNTITPAEKTVTYAVPKQLGYFKQENLDVSYLLTDRSTAIIQAILSGYADSGYASTANIIAAVDKIVPIKAFADGAIKWPYYTAAPEGSKGSKGESCTKHCTDYESSAI